ncbi:MAG: hypothetical protein KF830_04245 [Planctomycetes bacterium]|nr:hypothetical protein [Planctomycetota bacterium]
MKTMLLTAWLAAFAGGDREEGLRLYREGRFAEAAQAFRRAVEHEGDSAELQWNLALASWRAGDLAAAETAAEKYAALAKDARRDLHRGLLGNVRYAEAQALEAGAEALLQGGAPPPAAGTAPPDPLPLLEQALDKVQQAQEHFVAGAVGGPAAALPRNAERALRYAEALQQRIEELKRQRQEQQQEQQQQQQEQPDGDQPQPKAPPADEPGDPDQAGQRPEDAPPDGEPPPEGAAEPQPQPAEGEPPPPAEAEDAGTPPPPPRHDAPGEAAEGKELTPEQTQRLLEQLRQLDQKLQQLRARSRSGRRPVERDW